MTTDTDKLPQKEVDELLDHIYEYGTAAEGVRKRILDVCTAFASAHIASLCGDVEPVAFMYPSDLAEFERKEMVAEAVSVSCTSVVTHERTVPLYSASTVAALKARVAELEKDAWRLDAVEANRFEIHNPYKGGWDVVKYQPDSCRFMEMKTGASTVRAAIDAALAAKGQA